MQQSSGLIKKLLLVIGVSAAIIFSIIASVSLSTMSQLAGSDSEFAVVQSQTILFFGLGFILVILCIIFAARGIEKKYQV